MRELNERTREVDANAWTALGTACEVIANRHQGVARSGVTAGLIRPYRSRKFSKTHHETGTENESLPGPIMINRPAG